MDDHRRGLADDHVRSAWVQAVAVLGGDAGPAARAADDLVARYREPPRHYHDTAHVAAVLGDAADLCDSLGADAQDRAVVLAAACAHDVVYRGRAGQDEQDSAAWARQSLVAAGVGPGFAERVHVLVLATAEHRAPEGDVGAAILLDADLSVLAREPDGYAAYVAAVRCEYAHVDDEQWRTGRRAVLLDLLGRERLYATSAARDRWQPAARANLARELGELGELGELSDGRCDG